MEPNQEPKAPYLSIYFECCRVYRAIYRNAEKTAYVGCCPRCLRQVRVDIGPGGSKDRIFRAG